MPRKKTDTPGQAVERVRLTYDYLLGSRASRKIDLSEVNRKVRDALVPLKDREEIRQSFGDAAADGLFPGRFCEASIRLVQDKMLATRQGSQFRKLADEDLILLSLKADAAPDNALAPPHRDWHQAIYREHSQVNVVILSQPAALTALAGLHKLPEPALLISARDAIGEVALCDPETASVVQEAGRAKVLMIPGIGGLAHGESIEEALYNLETADLWCDITLRTLPASAR